MHKDIDPGELTDLRAASVNNENFAAATVRKNLHFHLQHSSGLLQNQITEFARLVSGSYSNNKASPPAKCPKVSICDFESWLIVHNFEHILKLLCVPSTPIRAF